MREPTIQRASRDDLVRIFAERGFRRGAEIGVRQGAFALALCCAIDGLELLCVDPWRHYATRPKQASQDRQEVNYRVAVERLVPYNARVIRQFSLDAALAVAPDSLDFVYIDGNHAYPYVREDLMAWSACVRPGGIVSGDDYDAPGVARAVREFVAQRGIDEWFVIDERRRRNRNGQHFRSWWWVQP